MRQRVYGNPTGVPSGTGVAVTAATASPPILNPTRLRVAPVGSVGIPVGRLVPAFDDLGALLVDTDLTLRLNSLVKCTEVLVK